MVIGNKRAQFFLLAAVIIVAVVISLGVNPNRATVNREPESFYDFSYEVQRETGAVIDYEIYSDFAANANLSEFVNLLAYDIRDKNPDANFMFVYGSTESGMDVKNFSSTDENVISDICYGGFCQEVRGSVWDFNSNFGTWHLDKDDLVNLNNISVKVRGYDFDFPISEHRQVIFIMQKEVGDESFVTAE